MIGKRISSRAAGRQQHSCRRRRSRRLPGTFSSRFTLTTAELSLGKLARIVSVSQPVLNRWLALLEQRHLITGARHDFTQEFRAVLTPAGRALLDRYLSATSDLQIGAHH